MAQRSEFKSLYPKYSNKPYNLVVNGETKSLRGWARETGIDRATIRKRVMDLGWAHSCAVLAPVSLIVKHTCTVEGCKGCKR